MTLITWPFKFLTQWVLYGVTFNIAAFHIVKYYCPPSIAEVLTPTTDPSGEAIFGMNMWYVLMGAVIFIVAVVMLLNFIMKSRSFAEGVVLGLWSAAKDRDKKAHSRLFLENVIVGLAKSRLKTRKRSAKSIVAEIQGEQPVSRTKAPRELPDDVTDIREWKRAA